MSTFRESELDEAGDPDSPRGSRPWAIAVLRTARARISEWKSDAYYAGSALRAVSESEVWKILGYASFGLLCDKELKLSQDIAEALITAKPDGSTVGDVITLATKTRILAGHGGNRTEQGSVTILKDRGTDYLTARIARDRPDVLERMKAGEFKSVRAAAVEVGIVKPTIQIVTDDAERIARQLKKHCTPKVLRELKGQL